MPFGADQPELSANPRPRRPRRPRRSWRRARHGRSGGGTHPGTMPSETVLLGMGCSVVSTILTNVRSSTPSGPK